MKKNRSFFNEMSKDERNSEKVQGEIKAHDESEYIYKKPSEVVPDQQTKSALDAFTSTLK